MVAESCSAGGARTLSIPDDLITVAEAARLANNTHRSTVRRWIAKGKLRAYAIAGARWRVSRADVVVLIELRAPGERVDGSAPAPPPPASKDEPPAQHSTWVDEVLKKHRVRK